jgi:DNA polymerase-3 subunit alpha
MLNNHSKFSLRYGIKSVDWMINWAASTGYHNIVLTDINNTSAALSFIQLSKQRELSPIIGVDIRNGIAQQYILLARNNRGFHELNRFLSYHLHQSKDFNETPDFLPNCFVIYPFGKQPSTFRNNEFIGIHPKQLNLLSLRTFKQKNRLVSLQSMTFENKRDFNAHRLLRSIDQNCLLSKLPTSAQASPEDSYLSYTEFADLYKYYTYIITQTVGLLKE